MIYCSIIRCNFETSFWRSNWWNFFAKRFAKSC